MRGGALKEAELGVELHPVDVHLHQSDGPPRSNLSRSTARRSPFLSSATTTTLSFAPPTPHLAIMSAPVAKGSKGRVLLAYSGGLGPSSPFTPVAPQLPVRPGLPELTRPLPPSDLACLDRHLVHSRLAD